MTEGDYDYAERKALHYAAMAVDLAQSTESVAAANAATVRTALLTALERCAQWEAVARVLRRR